MSDLQQRFDAWLRDTMGSEIANDVGERNWRFAEEAVELLQACGMKVEDLLRVVATVYEKEPGDPAVEIGDVLCCLYPLATARGYCVETLAEHTLRRNYDNQERIRAKHVAKILRRPLEVKPDAAA